MDKLKSAVKVHDNTGVSFALASVMLVSAAQLLMKWAMLNLGSYIGSDDSLIVLFEQTYPYLLALCGGLICYAVSMLLWVKALHTLTLSRAYPLLSLSYGVVYFGAIITPGLNEPFSWIKMTGILFIFVGISLIFKKPAKNRN